MRAMKSSSLPRLIDAPVVAFRSGRGIVSNAHELGLTMAAAYRLWPNTDLMIGIGTRLELPTMSRWPYRPDGLKSIRIDIDPVGDAPLHARRRRYLGRARPARAICSRRCSKRGYSKTSGRRAAIREASAAALQQIQKIQPQMAYLNILREVLPDDAIVTDELSQVGFASWYGFPVYEPRTFITSGYQGTLGSGFPDRARRQGRAIPTGRWSRSPAMAASCSACRNWRPRCSSTSAW